MSISRGEIVGVIGRNGVGKSTLMRCLIWLLDTWRGTITFMDQDVTRLQADARARAGFGYIPQGRDVFPQMSVEENLQVGELIGGPKAKKLPELVYEYFPRLKERRRQIAGPCRGRATATGHRARADRKSELDDSRRAVGGRAAVDRAAHLRSAEVVPD
jgi:branched-chain amino acid transport system ATP-binding protein